MKWSSSSPDREGWWWMRLGTKPEYGPNIVCIEKNYSNQLTINDSANYDSNWNLDQWTKHNPNTEWAGPLQEPEENS